MRNFLFDSFEQLDEDFDRVEIGYQPEVYYRDSIKKEVNCNADNQINLELSSDTIERICLSKVVISSKNLEFIQTNYKSFKILRVYKAQLSCSNLASLGFVKNLKTFQLIDSEAKDFRLEYLSNASQLEELQFDFADTEIKGNLKKKVLQILPL